ncbi:hypothetical protein [Sphingomonas sp. PP-CC-1A-547]|uniref:hypothetical protein n=1 Tax=Sphingomonas sp. PP-CC-1A-547 TaxID=2135654 RepID=UPI0011C41425|nr:hypothetical protein [Sphingomonas sp. PP-CC-1A-547]
MCDAIDDAGPVTTSEQQAVPVAQECLFDVQPQVSAIDNGPEPSLRDMVRSFYNRHAIINPDAVTEQYLAALSLPCKSGEGAGEAPGMKPWAGGDAAPVDWDGGPVILRNGSTMFPSNMSLAYHANGTNRWDHDRKNRNPAWDIIAYSAALTPDATQTREAELQAEIERLRGLLISPGDPAWEDARAVLVAELRKNGMDTHADNIAASHAVSIPSWIALNLIGHSRAALNARDVA